MKASKVTVAAIKTYEAHVRDGGRSITAPFQSWTERKVAGRIAFASGRKAWCSRCGQEFPTTKLKGKEVCPHCGSKLEVVKSRCWYRSDVKYVQELTTYGQYQVVRTYIVDIWYRKKEKPRVYVFHAYDWMFDETGRKWCFSRKMTMFPNYRRIPFSLWDGTGRPLVYKKNAAYSDWNSGWKIDSVYTRKRVAEWAKKFRLTGDLQGLDVYNVLTALISGSYHFETVWKMRDKELCKAILYDGGDAYWPQIKIALRHGFKFMDWWTWRDHINLLKDEGYDIFNPRYIAPADLNADHNRLIEERNARWEREERERERQRKIAEIERSKALKDPNSPLNVEYRSRIGKALAVVVMSGNIVIKPLQDIRDFYEEGKALHHCVYMNKYYEESGSLILGAKVSGKRTETIELNLKTFQIEQCRGKYNQDSKYHQAIYSLMKKAIFRYKKAYSVQHAG